MTLKDALKIWARDRKDWPGGFNFKNKSEFLGISHGLNDKQILISQELIDSDEWSVAFRPHDKETIAAINGLFEHINNNGGEK